MQVTTSYARQQKQIVNLNCKYHYKYNYKCFSSIHGLRFSSHWLFSQRIIRFHRSLINPAKYTTQTIQYSISFDYLARRLLLWQIGQLSSIQLLLLLRSFQKVFTVLLLNSPSKTKQPLAGAHDCRILFVFSIS